MKKAFCISLSVLIFIVSCGFTLAVSYCPMNEEIEVSLTHTKACCCEDENGDECCMDAQIKLDKIKDNYLPADNYKAPDAKKLGNAIILSHSVSPCFTSPKSENLFSDDKAPPGVIVPRSILFSVFII
jgi:hypothetical protein